MTKPSDSVSGEVLGSASSKISAVLILSVRESVWLDLQFKVSRHLRRSFGALAVSFGAVGAALGVVSVKGAGLQLPALFLGISLLAGFWLLRFAFDRMFQAQIVGALRVELFAALGFQPRLDDVWQLSKRGRAVVGPFAVQALAYDGIVYFVGRNLDTSAYRRSWHWWGDAAV